MAQRIMVINDTPEILDLFRELLTDEGFEVYLYSFAIQDLSEVERVDPDLIILDYVFGSETLGWQFLQKLKMRRSTAQIPVIICTAAVKAVRDIEGYLKAKGIEVVPKPFDIEDLLAAVRSALENREYIASLQEPDAQEDEEAPSNGESLITKPLRHGNPLDNDGDD
jgi:DNA-binding response OmpR family regulator